MRKLARIKLLVVFGWTLLFVGCGEDEPIKEQVNSTIEEEIFTLVNEYRFERGLRLLVLEENASLLALQHSQNMADGSVDFGHDGFEERADTLFEETGANGAGENVAWGQRSADEVMESWINSEGHRENIEGDFTHIGIGVANDAEGVPFYTQIFLRI